MHPFAVTSRTGCYIVRAHVFGKWRKMRLLGRQGGMAPAESTDDHEHGGSKCIYMVYAGIVHHEDLQQFNQFMAAAGVTAREMASTSQLPAGPAQPEQSQGVNQLCE